MNLQKKLDDLIIEIYTTNFKDALWKIENLSKKYPELLEDSELIRKISLLEADCLEQKREIQGALDIYLNIWEENSVDSIDYITTASKIVQLYLDLHNNEMAVHFATRSLETIEKNGYQNYDLVIAVSLLKTAVSSNENDPILQSFGNY